MAFLGKILESIKIIKRNISVPVIKAVIYNSQNINAERFLSPGDDSDPLPDDMGFFVKNETTGGLVFVGSLDQKNEPEALKGEKRFYSRDDDGNIKATIWIFKDGKIKIFNEEAAITIYPSGQIIITSPNEIIANAVSFIINGNLIVNGSVGITGTLTLDGINMNQHVHGGVTAGGSVTLGPE